MNASELRAKQAPLKEQYKEAPEKALYILSAEGSLGEEVSCTVGSHTGEVTAGLHPATGGSGEQACSGDMLLEALAACAGVTLNAVATAMGIDIEEGKVRAEGDLDFRGTLGVDRQAPVGFSEIRLSFEVTTETDQKKLEKLLELTERYCVVYQTLTNGVPVQAAIHKVAKSG